MSDLVDATREVLANSPTLKEITDAQDLCDCGAKPGELHGARCATIERLEQLGVIPR